MAVSSGTLGNMDCLWMGNDHVRLAVTTGRGPRVVFWGWQGGANLFAELRDAAVPTPNGTFYFLGGHRLWHAPEALDTTYRPDNEPLLVETVSDNNASFIAPPDGNGIAKSMTVKIAPDGPDVSVTHTISNFGQEPVRLAPWAISMNRPGGVALLPQPDDRVDPNGFLPNRHVSLWPYTDINDSRLLLGNRVILVKAEPGPNNKIGYRNTHGWLAYWLDGTLGVKRFDPTPTGEYPDGGCNAEVFFAADVIELETLGPFVQLEPGARVTHSEVWSLHKSSSPPQSEEEAEELANKLGLNN